MRNASSAFKQALADGRVDYTLRAVVTLIDETVITLTNDDIWENGLVIDDAVSGDGDFQLGSAIINQCTISINNIYDDYSAYDFFGANVIVYVGFADLEGDTTEELLMGHYTVSDTAYNGSLITLTCLDNMMKFDKAYNSTLAYPATLGDIVLDACTHCGVTLDNSYLHFANYDYEVAVRPSGESTTYRQVISWAAQIAGCFARINSNGNLEIKFFDTVTLASYTSQGLNGGYFDNGTPTYTSGDTADGGTFNPWNTGYEADGGTFAEMSNLHYIQDDFGSNLATDDVVITGVKVVLEVNSDTISQYASAYDETSTYAIGAKVTYENQLYECVSAISTPEAWNSEHWKDISQMEYTAGTTGYVISVEGNPLVTGGSAGQALTTYLGGLLIGMRFRTGSVTHPSDPTIEAGDLFVYTNRKMQSYAMLVSSTNFASGSNQTTQSSAATPQRNSAQRFSESTQTYVQLRKQIYAQKSYLEQQLAASGGLYYTEVPQPGGGAKVYYHNKPKLSESNIQMVFTDVGFTMTDDAWQSQYGMTVDGTMIAEILQATGVDAEWIRVGTELGGWKINSNSLVGVRNKKDADGTDVPIGYTTLKPPANIQGKTSEPYDLSVLTGIQGRIELWWAWEGGGTREITIEALSTADTFTFGVQATWHNDDHEYDEGYISGDNTETSLEFDMGWSATSDKMTYVYVRLIIPANTSATGYNHYDLLARVSDGNGGYVAPYNVVVGAGTYATDITGVPTDVVPDDASLSITNALMQPYWYVRSDGNMLANALLALGGIATNTSDGIIQDLYNGIPGELGGFKQYPYAASSSHAPSSYGGQLLVYGDRKEGSIFTQIAMDESGLWFRNCYNISGQVFGDNWICLTKPITNYPVGSVYITDSNTNPSTILGGGTWTLIKRVFANKNVQDAVTFNTTNTVSGSTSSVFLVSDTRISFRIMFTNKVELNDTAVNIGTLDISKLGISSFYYGRYMAVDDTGNAGVIIEINNNSPYNISVSDVVGASRTIAASTATSPTITLMGSIEMATGDILNSACNEFHWHRTA